MKPLGNSFDFAGVFHRSSVFMVIGISAIVLGACDNRSFTHGDPLAATKLAAVATNDIAKNPELQQTAMTLGASIYDAACRSCHGADLKGLPDKHTPDLTDAAWMFAGDDYDSGGVIHFPADVEKTILYGIRADDNPKTKKDADMPPLGPQGRAILTLDEISDVAEYVLMLGKQPFDVGKANRAQKIWNDKGSCYDCHDPEGVGNEAIGAANLTAPRLYLYGSDRQSITQSITFGRHGVSPAFEGKLTAGEIKAVSVYVFSFAKHG